MTQAPSVRAWVKLPDIQWHTMQQFEHNRIADAVQGRRTVMVRCGSSVYEKDGQLGRGENMLGCAAKNHLPQSALGVGTLNQQVRTLSASLRKQRNTRSFSTGGDRFLRGGNAVSPQMTDRLLPGRTGDHIALHTGYYHALGFAQ